MRPKGTSNIPTMAQLITFAYQHNATIYITPDRQLKGIRLLMRWYPNQNAKKFKATNQLENYHTKLWTEQFIQFGKSGPSLAKAKRWLRNLWTEVKRTCNQTKELQFGIRPDEEWISRDPLTEIAPALYNGSSCRIADGWIDPQILEMVENRHRYSPELQEELRQYVETYTRLKTYAGELRQEYSYRDPNGPSCERIDIRDDAAARDAAVDF